MKLTNGAAPYTLCSQFFLFHFVKLKPLITDERLAKLLRRIEFRFLARVQPCRSKRLALCLLEFQELVIFKMRVCEIYYEEY